MKHRLMVSILSLAILSLAAPVSAQDGPEVRVNVEIKRASSTDVRASSSVIIREQRKASSTERRVSTQVDIAKRKAEYVAKVFLATITRLERIITRIESRMDKIEAQGGITTESERFVAAAKVNLADAKAKLSIFASLDFSSELARDNFERIRNLAAEIRADIKAAHTNLMMAVRALKGPNTGLNVEAGATSTATST